VAAERAPTGGRRAWSPGWLWPTLAAPATAWLLLLFVVPFYVIVAIAFGQLDPLFLTPVPIYNPAKWNPAAFGDTLGQLLERGTIFQESFLRTLAYVSAATGLCLAIAYPVAYFIARHAGRFRTPFLVAVVAPFWISYMMRMLAWIMVLRPEGYANDVLRALRLVDDPVLWLNGRPVTVIVGLAYGYLPYMLLVLFAGLDRIPSSNLEASRDLGAGQIETFVRVTLPLSRQAILAGVVIVSLPMFGDYYTQTLLAGTRDTSMLGNLIVGSMQSSLVQAGASLVLILMVLLLLPMLYYLRASRSELRL
jgi:spermidine/putrescine transport system permease protein